MAHEGPEDVTNGGPGEVAEEVPGEADLLGIADEGLPAPVEPEEQKPCETQIHKWARESTC